MSETPEIPEVEDPFSKRVAITIAIIAVIMTLLSSLGDNAKTDALVTTTKTANAWAFFQSKSIKETNYEATQDVLSLVAIQGGDEALRTTLTDKFEHKIAKYESEKAEIKAQAEGYEAEAKAALELNDKIDFALLFLQMAVVLCSVAILVKLHPFWWLGIAAGLLGSLLGAKAVLLDGSAPKAAHSTPLSISTTTATPTPH